MIALIITALIAYLIGSVPTSYITGRLCRGIDIRKFGSGNVGATNAFRVLGKKMGLAVLLIDMLKGAGAVYLLSIFFCNQQNIVSPEVFNLIAATAVIFGHIWSIFLKLEGGKGVATACGAFLVLMPKPTLACLIIWFFVAVASKYVSLASIIMISCLPLISLLYKQPLEYTYYSILIGVLILFTHRANIGRLIEGKENRIGQKNTQA